MKRSIERLTQRLSNRGSFAKSVLVLAGGTAFGQGLAFIAAPVLTRIYSPADFGVLAVFAALLSSFTPVTSLRYQLAIPLPEDDDSAANLLALSLLLAVLLSGLAALVVALGGDWVAARSKSPGLRPYLWLLPLSLLGAGVYTAISYWAIRRQEFRAIARTRVDAMIATVAAQLGVRWLVGGPFGLVFGDALGRMTGCGSLMRLAWRDDAPVFRRVSVAGIRRAASRYRRFPLISTLSSLLNSFGSNLPTLVLAAFFGPQVLGLLALSQRMLGAPSTLVGQAVGQVYGAQAAQMVRGDRAALHRLFRSTGLRLLALGVLPTLVLIAVGPQLFAFVFGASWRAAGEYSRVLALMYLAQFVAVPLSSTTDVLELQGLQFLWDAGRLVLVVGSLYFAGRGGASATVGIAVFGLAMLVAYVVYLILMERALSRVSDPSLQSPLPVSASSAASPSV